MKLNHSMIASLSLVLSIGSRLGLASMPALALAGCDNVGGEAEEGGEDGEGGEGGEGGSAGSTAMDTTCSTGERWTGGDRESPMMHPGRDCVACHSQRGEATSLNLAGTVFDVQNEKDDCFGVADVTIEITGADGQVTSLTSNDAGNFSRHVQVAMPYTAKLVYEGRERVMATPQSSLSCNSCHGAVGTNNAPGRILAP